MILDKNNEFIAKDNKAVSKVAGIDYFCILE